VVVDRETLDGVHIRDVPPALDLLVRVDALDQRRELTVAARRDVDADLGDRLGGREPRLALGLLRDRLVDPLLRFLVELGQSRLGQAAAVVGGGAGCSLAFRSRK
jgi:hypothetical protein